MKLTLKQKPPTMDKNDALRNLLALRANHSLDWQLTFQRLLRMTQGQLEAYLIKKGKDVENLEKIIANAILEVVTQPNLQKVALLQEMACGPAPKQTEEPFQAAKEINPFDNYPLDTVIKMIAELDRRIKERECQQSTPAQLSQWSPPS